MISVIVPIYNTEKYLDKCLTSLVNQSLKDIEIICVNDGSSDNSQKIVDKYVKKYPGKVKSFIKKNGGLSDARNFGIEKSRGEYIGFVDSDDFVELDMFEKMYEFGIKKSLDIVVCDTIMDYPNHTEILKTNLHYSEDDIKNYLISYPMACIRLIKKSLFTDNYFFTKDILYEDLCLMPTFVNKTNKIGFLEEPLYHYVQRSNSIMNQSSFNKRFLEIEDVLNKVYNSFENNNNLKKYSTEIEYLYITHLLRSASLRFLNFKDGIKPLASLIDNTIKRYPDWKNNVYYKKSSLKLRIICTLAAKKKFRLLKIIMKVRKS